MFPEGSQVPKLFPPPPRQDVPNSTSDLSHLVLIKVLYMNWKGKLYRGVDFILFCEGVQRDASIGEWPMFQKIRWWADQYGSSKTKNKSCERAHELINMNHTMLQSLAKVSMHSDPSPSTRVATLLADIFHKGKKNPGPSCVHSWAVSLALWNFYS
jgi:hypothetical protein